MCKLRIPLCDIQMSTKVYIRHYRGRVLFIYRACITDRENSVHLRMVNLQQV